jgi:hypothetical protein
MENIIRYRCRGETGTTFFDPHKNGEWVKASDHERREIYLKQKMACPYCKSGAGDRIAELEAQLARAEDTLAMVNRWVEAHAYPRSSIAGPEITTGEKDTQELCDILADQPEVQEKKGRE